MYIKKLKDVAMTRIIVEIDDNKAAILEDKAKKFGLLPEQFVSLNQIWRQRYKRFYLKIRNFMNGWPDALSFHCG
jgi:hypothetical protein